MQTIQEKLTVCASAPDDSIVSLTLGELRAMARANWAMQVLDARHLHTGLGWRMTDFGQRCMVLQGYVPDSVEYYGATPGAARLAAAEAVISELPESVRQQLAALEAARGASTMLLADGRELPLKR